MAIETICSACESRFTVQDDLVGRPMRCPECREVFHVRAVPSKKAAALKDDPDKAPASDKSGKNRSDAPVPKYRSGSVSDFLHVLPTDTEPPETAKPPQPLPDNAPLAEEESFPDFEVVEDKPPTKSAPPRSKSRTAPREKPIIPDGDESRPTEVKWSPDLAPPPSRRRRNPGEEVDDSDGEDAESSIEDELDQDESPDNDYPRSRSKPDDDDDDERPPRRRRKKKSRFVLMFVLVAVIAGSVGIGGFLLKKHLEGEPERLYEKARKDYDQKNYEPARKQFEELAREHPKHQRAAEAKFFIELCSLRIAVHSVTVGTDPVPAQTQLERFLKAMEQPGMQPFLEPGRFDVDVWQCLLRLDEALIEKGTSVFKEDSPDESENWLHQAEAVGITVDRFRPKEMNRENVYQQMAVLRKQIDGARTRARFLAAAKERLGDADDKIIEVVRADAQNQFFYSAKESRDVALVDDSSFKQLIADVEKRIRDRVAYKRLEQPIAPGVARGNGGTGLLFAPRVDVPDPNRIPLPAGPSSVFFALARGVLYALDDGDGRVLWATRVGIDSDSLPLHLPGSDLHPELVLVTSNDGTQAGLTARLARTGEAFWHQALPSPVVGRPLLVGQRVFVPLSEHLNPAKEVAKRVELGTVLEIEIASGSVLGKIVLGRPLGGNAARRPGTGQLYFPAEAKGVYVFDVEKIGPDGGRLDPTFLGILDTGHAAGTLRGDPVITAGDGDTPSYLILSLTEGLDAMKLRAFPIAPPDQAPSIQGSIPPPITLAGWSWFPPYCDTEKLAVVTDRGEFGLFGIKQSGNLDVPLFVLPPTPYLVPDIRMPTRGQIVYADEHDFWFLARGLLYHLKIGFDAERGLRLVQRGTPIPIGEPLQPSQINARGDFALVVTQGSASASCRATAIDLRTGKVRWQRQLGLVAQGDPIRIGDAVVLMDHDGGLFKIDAAPLRNLGDASWLIEEKWLVAPPLNDVAEIGQFLPGSDGASAFAVLTTRAAQGLRIVVRRYVPGQPVEERSAALPAPLAGKSIVIGKQVIIPLANGLLYRMNLTANRALEAGPTWRGERVSPLAVCHLTAINEHEFLATDGSRDLNRWRWISEQDDFSKRGSLTLAERIAAPPLFFVEGDAPRVFVIDIRNNATLWDADRLAMNTLPVRAWRSGEKGVLPAGVVTNGPYFERDQAGQPRIAIVLDRSKLIWLAPNAAAPLWIWQPKESAPGESVIGKPMVLGDRLYLTHQVGKCTSLGMEKGEPRDESIRLSGSAIPATAAIVLDGFLLAPLADGTLLLQTTGAKPAAKSPVFLLPLLPFGAVVPLPLQP